MSLKTAAINRSVAHPPDDMSMDNHGGMMLTEETEEIGENLSMNYFVRRKTHMC
jgi:hypothetical protein